VHRVVAGDTLTRLARRYQTTPEAIRALNGLRGDELKLGQVVRVQ
jgi:LysM repeat protein